MEEKTTLNEREVEEVSGGAAEAVRPNGPITVICPNCRSRNTYIVRVINRKKQQIKIFHCSDCNQDFERSESRPIVQKIS